MDVRHLSCFVAVAEELHFGRAAERLHVAQPAVSQTIRQLERELGVVLFERSHRGVALSAAGKVFLEESRAVLARLELATASMAPFREGDRTALVIGVVAALPPLLVPALVAEARRSMGDVGISLRPIPATHDVAQMFDADPALDLVLVRTPVTADRWIDSRVVAREPVGVAVHRTHSLAGADAVRPEQLNGEVLATFPRAAEPETYDAMMAALHDAGFSGAKVLQESHAGAVDASLRLVASGAAVSLKLASEVQAFNDSEVVWRPLAGVAIDVVVRVAWVRSRMTGPKARLLAHLPEVTR